MEVLKSSGVWKLQQYKLEINLTAYVFIYLVFHGSRVNFGIDII